MTWTWKGAALASAGVALALTAGAVLAASAPGATKELAAACARKIDTVMKASPRLADAPPRRTVFSEGELNSWFAFDGIERLPVGVTDPAVTLLGDGRAQGRAVVDLDLMGKKRGSGGRLDPWSYLGGRVPVVATGVVRTDDGVGRFLLESAQVSGITVPKWLLQEMVSFYAKSPSRPRGISIDDPFALPVGIENLEVGKGQAVVIQ
jgi:hypothetical protein